MNNLILTVLFYIVEFLIVLGIFVVLSYITKFAVNKIKSVSYFKTSRFFNPTEYLPEEEIHSMKQVFNLIMILVLTMNIIYLIFSWRDTSFDLLLFDLIISLYLSLDIDRSSFKNKLILFSLVPFGSISYLLDPSSMLWVLDIFQVVADMYFIKVYYSKFLKYTFDNRLGITIMLLFLIVFVSFFITMIVENVSPLNSLVMVSNAFTSNGYAVLGKSGLGKINAIILVWSGFILSGVGTATLTTAIVKRQVDSQFDYLESLVKKNKKD